MKHNLVSILSTDSESCNYSMQYVFSQAFITSHHG